MIWIIIAIIVVLVLIKVYSAQGTKIILFSNDKCPFCVAMRPEWDRFRFMTLKNKVNFDVIEVDTGNNSEFTRRAVDQYKVSSVPTILKVNGQNVTKYEGPYDGYAFMSFAKNEK